MKEFLLLRFRRGDKEPLLNSWNLTVCSEWDKFHLFYRNHRQPYNCGYCSFHKLILEFRSSKWKVFFRILWFQNNPDSSLGFQGFKQASSFNFVYSNNVPKDPPKHWYQQALRILKEPVTEAKENWVSVSCFLWTRRKTTYITHPQETTHTVIHQGTIPLASHLHK